MKRGKEKKGKDARLVTTGQKKGTRRKEPWLQGDRRE